MKKYFIALSVLMASCSTTLLAQDNSDGAPLHKIELGFRFMPTLSSFNIETNSSGASNTVKTTGTISYGFGGFVAYNITKNIGIQGEVLYNSLSQKYKDQNLDRKISVKYVNIPLLLTLSTNRAKRINLTVVAGPEIGFNIGSDISTGSGNASDTVKTVFAVKKNDFGVAYGAGLGFMLNEARTVRLDIGYRGVYGLVNISNSANNTVSGTYISLDKANIRTNAAYIGIALVL